MRQVPPPDPASPYGQLCNAVGLLFLQWAKLEGEMSASLRLHMQRQARSRAQGAYLAAAIYGSMRMKAARDTMKRIAQEFDYGEKAIAFHEAFFSHIGHIEDFRDKLAHLIVMKENDTYDGHWKMSDIVTSRSYSSMKVYTFETSAVYAAAQDLVFAHKVVGGFLKKGARRTAPKLPPWLYKSSTLKLQVRKIGPLPRSPLHRRLSSRALSKFDRER